MQYYVKNIVKKRIQIIIISNRMTISGEHDILIVNNFIFLLKQWKILKSKVLNCITYIFWSILKVIIIVKLIIINTTYT